MRRLTLIAAVATLLAALSACQYAFPLEVRGSLDTPTVEIGRWGVVRQNTPCIRRIMVTAVADRFGDPIWDAATEQCRELDEITYGLVPNGFSQAMPAEPLREGRVYLVEAQATGGWGVAYVTFLRNGWRVVDADWRNAPPPSG